MNVVSLIPTQKALDNAWAEYQRLAKMAADNPSLWADRTHTEETIRAHKRFEALFLALDTAA